MRRLAYLLLTLFENWPVFQHQQPQALAMLEKVRAAAHREVKAGR